MVVRAVASRYSWSLVVALLSACTAPDIRAATDKLSYELPPGDTTTPVRITARNIGNKPGYLLMVDEQVDVLLMVRIGQGEPERWSISELHRRPGDPLRTVVHRLDPESSVTSTFHLPRGQYRMGFAFGDTPDTMSHATWLPDLRIR